MATAIPKYIKSNQIWPMIAKPGWAQGSSISGGGLGNPDATPMTLDLDGGYVNSGGPIDTSTPDTTLVNKKYVKDVVALKADKVEVDNKVKVVDDKLVRLETELRLDNQGPVKWSRMLEVPQALTTFGGGPSGITMSASMDMKEHPVDNLPAPLSGPSGLRQATNRQYVDSNLSMTEDKIRVDTNGAISSAIAALEPRLVELETPDWDDVQNKPGSIDFFQVVDEGTLDAHIQLVGDININGKRLRGGVRPVRSTDIANKQYVDEQINTKIGRTELDAALATHQTDDDIMVVVDDYVNNIDPDGFWTKIDNAISDHKPVVKWADVEELPAWDDHIAYEDGHVKISGGIDMDNARLMNLGAPQDPDDAVTLSYLNSTTSSGIENFEFNATNDTLIASKSVNLSGNTIKGLKTTILDPTDSTKVITYVPALDEAVSKRHLTDMILTTATKAYVDSEIESKVDKLDLRVTRERAAQQMADRMSSFKWSLARNGDNNEFTFIMDVIALSTLPYLNIERVAFRLKVEEIEVISGVRTGTLIKLMELTNVPLSALVSGAYKFTYTLPLGTSTPPISSATAPLLLTVSPELECEIDNEDARTLVYPTQFQVRRGSGINGITLIAE